jgi:channel protein (hemolysin III family)
MGDYFSNIHCIVKDNQSQSVVGFSILCVQFSCQQCYYFLFVNVMDQLLPSLSVSVMFPRISSAMVLQVDLPFLCHLILYLVGLYHIFDWSPHPEILLQKIDHCGIAILSVGTILPDAILLFGSNLSPGFPDSLGYAMASISILLCSYTCHQIMKQKPSISLQGVVAAWWVLPFLIPNYYYMTPIEFFAMLGCCVLQGCGVYVFTHQAPDLLPSYFGYHEIFHVLITGAGLCVLICNYSIVRRYGIAYQLGQL